MKKNKGSITIYLCIVFLSIIVLISVLAERARVSTIQSKCKAVTYMATESVLAGYGKQIFKDYGLLLAWENISIEESLMEYMQANINEADLKGTGTNFMNTSIVDITECEVRYVTDNGGSLFINQVKKYVKYAGLLKNAEDLINIFTNYTDNSNDENKEEIENITSIADENSDKLQSIVEDITDQIDKLKDIEELKEKYSAFKNNREDNNYKKLTKSYKKIIDIIDNKEKTVGKTIKLINDYKTEKEEFLKNSGYTDSINDYMENNLDILEKLGDEIIKVKELNVSKNTEWNSQKLKEVELCEERIRIIISSIDNLTVNKATEEDKERSSIFENAKELINKGIISLVLEDTKNISKSAISTINLPSNLKKEGNKDNLLDKSMLLVYSDLKFGNFMKPKKNTALKYEVEYFIGGKSSDSDNLAETIKQMVAARNLVNIGILLSDGEKMGEITSISSSVAAVTGLPFMEVVAKAVLVETWSLAESIYEVKSLFKENKILIVKTKNDWNTELTNLLKNPEQNGNNKGIDYETYCKMLLMLQSTNKISYRMMDLIQENIKIRYNSEFLMEKCFTALEVKTTFELKPLFMAMPWMLNMSGEKDTYTFQISRENSY